MRAEPHLISIDEVESLSIDDVCALYDKYISTAQTRTYSRFAFGRELAATAEGCYITTRDGRRILDGTGGIGVLNHGHNHPRILAARRKFQEDLRMEVHKAFHSPYLAALSANVAAVLPGDLNHSYFPNSGAEAVESAVKMAYKYHQGKRSFVLHSDISFHGKLLGSGGLTGSSEVGFDFPTIAGRDSFVYNDLDSVRRVLDKHTGPAGSDVYAIIIEPINVSSMKPCSEDFLRGLRALCDDLDIVLIFDEVYSGWGKTGDLFYFMRMEGLIPDILLYAKSFGGGKASISGLTARSHVFAKAYDNLADAMLQSTTYYGFGEENITAMEAIRIVVEDDYPARSRWIEDYLSAGLRALQEKYPDDIEEIRGAGALWGLKLARPSLGKVAATLTKIAPKSVRNDSHLVDKLVAGAVVDEAYRVHGVLLFLGSNQDTLLKMSLPLVAGQEECDQLLGCLDACLSAGLGALLAKFVKNNMPLVSS